MSEADQLDAFLRWYKANVLYQRHAHSELDFNWLAYRAGYAQAQADAAEKE